MPTLGTSASLVREDVFCKEGYRGGWTGCQKNPKKNTFY